MKALFLRVAVSLIFLTILRASAAAPSVATGNPTNITTNSATLNGTANPNGFATSAYFEWGTTTNYGSVTAPQSLGAGSSAVAVQANLTSLLTDTNYHYRLVASNSAGVSYGSNVIVTPTLLLYLYAGESWSYVFHDLPSAGLVSTFNPGFSWCILGFLPGSFASNGAIQMELFTDSTNSPGAAAVITPGTFPGTSTFFPLWLDDLEGGVRLTMLTGSVVVSSIFFEQVGDHFGSGSLAPDYRNTITATKFPQPPSFGTQFVSSVTISSAVVTLDINVKNLPTGTFVQWGTTTNYGSASGPTAVNFDYFVRRDITVSNLAPGTTYHFRVAATNSAGTTYGNDLVVTTLAPATVVTLPASNRKTTSATLNAAASINGLATTGYFEWGSTASYGQTTSLQNLGSPITVSNISAPITGLSPQTTYNYRAVVFSGGLTNLGSNVVFVTPPPPTNLVVTNLATDDVRGAIERGGAVTFACDGVLVLSNQIEIANDVSLAATGHAIIFSGSNVTRIFKVLPGTLFTLTNITLAHGRSTSGGALYNEGILAAYDCQFFSNAVIGASGVNGTNGLNGTNNSNCQLITTGTPGGPADNGQSAFGGAVLNTGSLVLERCYFSSNAALGGTGGLGGMGGRGGQCQFNGNGGAPGGNGGGAGIGGAAGGGAIANFGVLLVNSCTFSNSSALGGDGGEGGTAGQNPGVQIYNTGNSAPGGMGGAAQGSAIHDVGRSFVSNSLFALNSTVGGPGGRGGGRFNTSPNRGGNGGHALGGAVNVRSNAVLANCTLVANRATGGFGGSLNGYDAERGGNGGDVLGGALATAGNCQAVNLSMSSNIALGGLGFVSPVYPQYYSGTKGNSYGGSIANTGGIFQIVNSIFFNGTSNNCFGAITDLGHNISSDATPTWTSGTSLNNTDPLLLPLANNGGPTLTMALRAGSPALNTADCALAPATDQRGYPRPNGPGCDIGAYEGPGTTQLQIIPLSSSTNVLRWLAEAGQVYRLEITSDFNLWTPYATNTAGANGWLDFPVPANPSPRFFRLLAQ